MRLDRDWDALEEALPKAERAREELAADHAYGRDLDVAGHASLLRLLGPVTSERGRAILRSWLLEPASPATVTPRHGALRELAPATDFRAELTLRGRLEGPETLAGLAPFFAWAEGKEGHLSRATTTAAWILPPLTTAGLVGYLTLAWPPWWIVPALAQLILLRRHRHRLAATLADSSAGGPPLHALVPQLELVGSQPWADPLLLSLAERLGGEADAAHVCLRRLSSLLDSVAGRGNAFYAVLAPVLMLDVHLCSALDRWRLAHGASVRDWLEALGECEALASLATLAYDHPDWAYPTFRDGEPAELSASALGHPLIVPGKCVRNDVRVGPPGTFLLVTGSNMSGKSTLLRAIGANAVLAGAGTTVCAKALELTPLRLQTSMRVEDSLEEGISLFMAELLRIKQVVEAADEARTGGARVLYLLDEILHGTNTAERRIAARGVIRHLVRTGAIGAVSTHDLTLADAPDLTGLARCVHFREEVRSGDGSGAAPSLTFDFILRDGVATTRNALKLLDAVGLGGLELERDE